MKKAITSKYGKQPEAELEERAEIIANIEDPAEREYVEHELEYLEFDEPRPTYQRCELEAFLGDPDAYDVEAIEHEATAYDPATGRTVWTVGPEALADIAERHELYLYMAV